MSDTKLERVREQLAEFCVGLGSNTGTLNRSSRWLNSVSPGLKTHTHNFCDLNVQNDLLYISI